MERLVIILPDNTEVLRGPSGDSDPFFSKPKERVYVFPLDEQDFDSGRLKIGLIEDGEKLAEKFSVAIVEGRRKQLKEALVKFDSPNSKFLSNREKLKLLSEIESCLRGSEVVGPDSLKPY